MMPLIGSNLPNGFFKSLAFNRTINAVKSKYEKGLNKAAAYIAIQENRLSHHFLNKVPEAVTQYTNELPMEQALNQALTHHPTLSTLQQVSEVVGRLSFLA